jgi:DNA repair photolyase
MEKITFKPVGLPCGNNGSSKLYTTNLFTGKCPHHCVYCYATDFRGYSSDTISPVSFKAIINVTKWPKRLFLSSSTDPFHPVVIELAEELLERALDEGTFIVISTKALATKRICDCLARYSKQVSYTVSLSSLNKERNRLLEPNAPSAKRRLYGKKDKNQVSRIGIKQLVENGVNVTLKADCLFPGIDDSENSISDLLIATRKCGVEAVNLSYAFYRSKFKRRLSEIPFLNKALLKMNEIQDIASGRGYSLAIKEKENRLARMGKLAKDIGFKVISTCKCKNQIARVPRIMKHDCHFHDKWF